jgi:hypothetical protein
MKKLVSILVAITLGVILLAPAWAKAGQIRGYSAPATGVAASVTIAATGSGAGNMIKSISAAQTGTASTSIYVRDGASGTGAIIWQITLPAAAGVWNFPIEVLGSPNTATTVEFSAGSLFQTLSVTGVTQ